jgi:hypothetical protein
MAINFTAKERLLQKFKDSMSNSSAEDLEDVESELTLMELEKIDLNKVTVRDILKRMGIILF